MAYERYAQNPEQYMSHCMSLSQKPYAGFRVNTLKAGATELLSLLGVNPPGVSWCPEGFYNTNEAPLSKNPLHSAGVYYIQEPSAMCPAAVLNPAPGERVLDLCAAPGGKAAQLAAARKGKGVIVANDISASRAKALVKNISRAGVTNAVVTCETPERLSSAFSGWFDKILVDAPCSGEGMFRRVPGAVTRYVNDEDNPYPTAQAEILRRAAHMLSDGGLLAYSTCTFNVHENEEIISKFIEEDKRFAIVPLDHEALGVGQGVPVEGDTRLCGCGRIWPHLHKGEGHFIALLKKTGSKEHSEHINTPPAGAVSGAAFDAFCREALSCPPSGTLFRHGSSLFLQPPDTPGLSGLRVASSGFYLGDDKPSGFVPSQAFAMGLKPEQAARRVSFEHSDERVARYLRGESFEADAACGWNLVCAGKYPLGWAKARGGRLINKIDRGWITG